MRVYPFDVQKALLDSAKQEFLDCGFEKASLRSICKRAGVTTGAFYSYFEKKEDLFSAIVEPTIRKFYENSQSILHLQRQQHYTNADSEQKGVEFMLEHREEFILLFDCSAGTRYEGFREDVLNGFMRKSYQLYIDFHVGKPMDPKLLNILLGMKFEEYRQLLYSDYPPEEVHRLVRRLAGFTEAGFAQLMRDLQAGDE